MKETIILHMPQGNQDTMAREPVYDYADKRRSEYPQIGDQLDAIWKMVNGDTAASDAMKEQIRAIKERHPKPC